jgi:DNA polymerase III epsilon subunit-like protein
MSTVKVLLLDTETNGLPKNRQAPASMTEAWPAILQLSWATYTITGRTMHLDSHRDIGVALDPVIPWDAGAAKVHGISETEARTGTPAARALAELAAALRCVDVVVAHNLAFDKPVIRAAGYRVAATVPELRQLWPAGKAEFCTMRETRDLLQLPSPNDPLGRFKPPRLNELYTWLYGHVYDISGATLHSARSDTHCLSQCVAGLLRRGLLIAEGGSLRLATAAAAPSLTTTNTKG